MRKRERVPKRSNRLSHRHARACRGCHYSEEIANLIGIRATIDLLRKAEMAGRIVMNSFRERSRMLGILRLAAFAISVFVVLDTHGTGRSQDAGQAPARAVELDDWKVDPMRGPTFQIGRAHV